MSALDTQPGGDHYRNKAIQPVEYIHANGLGFLEGCIVKRITRWREKDGIKDLEKIKHECNLLIELEAKKANKPIAHQQCIGGTSGGDVLATGRGYGWGGLGK